MHTLNIEAASLLNIVNDILDFSKIEAGKFELEMIPFDLCVTINDLREGFQYKAYQKGLAFNCCMPSDVPTLLIGDPTRLRQILVNLVNNAMKFTDAGEILIDVRIAEDLNEGVKLRFLVQDTGIGIPADKQSLIFEKFVQADSSTSKKYGGTGLGVAICKQFVELMGGELRLQSEVGKGSTFEFTAIFTKQKEREVVAAGEKSDLTDKKVLIVDNCQADLKVMNECLASFGCKTVEASGGEEALAILRDTVSSGTLFDLILVSFDMTQTSSVALVKEIKKIYLFKEIPSIVITNVGKIGDAKVCKDLGVDGYLTKPIRKDYLRKAMELMVSPSTRSGKAGANQPIITRHRIAEEYHIKDFRILLVEDYPTNQLIGMKYLQRAGYHVDLAENGLQAIDVYEKKHHGLIFMDLQLPEMDGFEATRRIRAFASGTQYPTRPVIIAMTAHATTEIRDKCFKSGMDDFISKPVRRREILAIVEKWEDKMSRHRADAVPQEVVAHSPKPEIPEKIIDPQPPMSNKQTNHADPLDFAKGIEEFEGDEAFFMEVVEGFLENVRIQTKSIKQALSDGNSEIVKKEAHSIKGGAANLTAHKLSGIAAELENIGKSGDLKDGREVFKKLEQEFYSLETFVKNRPVV